jgi:hypothetical protein
MCGLMWLDCFCLAYCDALLSFVPAVRLPVLILLSAAQLQSCLSADSGFQFVRQLTFAMTDLRLHSEYVPGGNKSAGQIYLDTFEQINVSHHVMLCESCYVSHHVTQVAQYRLQEPQARLAMKMFSLL